MLLDVLLGCAGGDTTATTTLTDMSSMDMTCGEPGETWEPEMFHDGDAAVLRFTLLDIEPAPPDVGDNTWTVWVADATGGGTRTDLDLVISPFMPEHGHGGDDVAFTLQSDGTYRSDPFDLFMAGLWDLTLTATDADAMVVDTTTFTFCIEG